MARPIAATPTLRGKDAKRFIAATVNPQLFIPPKKNNEKALEDIKQQLLSREQKPI